MQIYAMAFLITREQKQESNMTWWNDLIRFVTTGEYGIAYRKVSNQQTLLTEDKAFQYKLLRPRFQYWYADPILYSEGGMTYVFLEMYDRIAEKGMIGVSYFDEKGKLSVPQKIIEEEFHLSFPEVFAYRDETYMIPESSAANQIRIYKKGKTVYDWTLFKVFEGMERCVDTVSYVNRVTDQLILINSKGCIRNALKSQLQIYLMDNWDIGELQDISFIIQNNENSLKVRNGGSLLHLEDELYRVVQESTETEYGKNILIYKINEIGVNGYKESFQKYIGIENLNVKIIPFVTKKKGTHTYAYKDGYEVLDISIGRISVDKFLRWVIKRVRRNPGIGA